MKIETKAKDNPRVIAIQKIYGKFCGPTSEDSFGGFPNHFGVKSVRFVPNST